MNQPLSRRLLLLSGACLVAAPALAQQRPAAKAAAALSAADKVLVDKAIAYLQGLSAARGRFTQTDARGKTATGEFYLQRPGRARFAYDPPNQLLMVSDGNQVAVADQRLKTYELFRLRDTPLALFLAKEIRLDRGVTVSSVSRLTGGFSLTASDLSRETPGAITMVFSENPMTLREWTVTDAQRGRTRVVLNTIAPAAGLSRALFTLPKDTRVRAPGKGR